MFLGSCVLSERHATFMMMAGISVWVRGGSVIVDPPRKCSHHIVGLMTSLFISVVKIPQAKQMR